MINIMRAFQADIVSFLQADSDLTNLLGGPNIFDAPPQKAKPPYIIVERHDGRQIEGQELRIVRNELDWGIWLDKTHRHEGLLIAEKLEAAIRLWAPTNPQYKLIHHAHARIQTRIDKKTGWTHIMMATLFSLEDLFA